jgi:hypothetical protein
MNYTEDDLEKLISMSVIEQIEWLRDKKILQPSTREVDYYLFFKKYKTETIATVESLEECAFRLKKEIKDKAKYLIRKKDFLDGKIEVTELMQKKERCHHCYHEKVLSDFDWDDDAEAIHYIVAALFSFLKIEEQEEQESFNERCF